MTNNSPFSAKRYEFAGSHVYYIPPTAFQKLELPVPTYLVGTRGTGKTTLMRALSWDERLYNESLHAQLGPHAFEKKYLGLYFKLPEVQLQLMDRWLSGEANEDYAALFAFYLDLCWLETAAAALKHLEARRVVRLTSAAEVEFVTEFTMIWDSYPQCRTLVGEAGSNIEETLALMHPLRRTLESFARRRLEVAGVLDAFPIEQIGSFGRRLGAMLSSALDQGDGDLGNDPTWSFRICMDEGETLSLRQQRVINSMVRLAKWPVFYLVAYVSRPLDATTTYLAGQTLQHADRQILARDDIKDREFKQLAEGVANVRIRSMLNKRVVLNTKRLLGKLDIDDLLERILRTSVNPEFVDLLEEAKRSTKPGSSPPIYETYLQRKRPELLLDSGATRLQRRRLSSASIRKQMVAAYLSICREARAEPMYASADMLFQISDKCIRDYLWQMDSIFTLTNVSLEEFLKSTVPVDVQDEALHSASALKMTLFREIQPSSPAEANLFVDGLARVTAFIQSTGRNYEQIRTPERGFFSYQLPAQRDPSGATGHEGLIRDAAQAGFLRMVDDPGADELKFRVHASLAPHYGFSYRGAYYAAAELTEHDINALATASTARSMESAVNSIVERITGRRARRQPSNQLRLEDREGGEP